MGSNRTYAHNMAVSFEAALPSEIGRDRAAEPIAATVAEPRRCAEFINGVRRRNVPRTGKGFR